tara:strand:+ start:362 stop:694 length:333 start_codon:yes stop_codon:yes gene_type:complete
MNLKQLTKNYFNIFSNKDVVGLRGLLAEDVYLRDWELAENGIENVVKANQNIFDAVDTISIIPIEICQTGNMTVSEMEIYINGREQVLNVVDVIEFNSDGKICAVRAYKG